MTPTELATLMADFGKAYTRWLHAELEQLGTTPARARLLMTLHCEGMLQMSEISNRLGVTARNVTKLVDGLEGEKLVQRLPHPTDRRATLIQLTDQGRLMCKQSMMSDHHSAAAQLFTELSPTDRKDFARVLKKMLAGLEHRSKTRANTPQ